MKIMDVLRTPFQLDTGSCGRTPNIIMSLKSMDVKIQYFAAKKGSASTYGFTIRKMDRPKCTQLVRTEIIEDVFCHRTLFVPFVPPQVQWRGCLDDPTAEPRSAQKGITWCRRRVRKRPCARGNNVGTSRRDIADFCAGHLEDDKSVLGRLQSCRLTTTQTHKENVKEEARFAWIRVVV